jgi:hypothetical protein
LKLNGFLRFECELTEFEGIEGVFDLKNEKKEAREVLKFSFQGNH